MNIKHFILFLFLFAGVPVFAQWSVQRCDTDCARMTLETDTLDYGSITHNANSFRQLKYWNSGKCPLIIWSVNGLTNRQLAISKNFLQPGDTGTISIYYPTGTEGRFIQAIVFYCNASTGKVLYIKGNIVHEVICANTHFATDTINLGPVHYVYGKHFTIKVPSTGHCPLMFHVDPVMDEYMEMINFSHQPIRPADSGTIDIHIGGEATGHYYGMLVIHSPNATVEQKTLFVKATLMPPAKGDSADTQITALNDMVDEGTTSKRTFTAAYTIKNTGKKPLVFKQPEKRDDMLKLPERPIPPGKTCVVFATFELNTHAGLFIRHINISGNFRGKTLPLYIKGNLAE